MTQVLAISRNDVAEQKHTATCISCNRAREATILASSISVSVSVSVRGTSCEGESAVAISGVEV